MTLVSFKESPFSPWGASLSRGSLSPLLDRTPTFQTVGCISAVNLQVGEHGLKHRSFLPPLIAEGSLTMSRPSEKKKSQEKEKTGSEDAKLIEFATFPGFSPEWPTPLPHGMLVMEQLRRVTRAQSKLADKREGFRECWRRSFYCPASQVIFLDTFWWIFLHRYQPNKPVQDKLFSRISDNYANLLVERVDDRWKDRFLKVYPDVIAQSVYSTFVYAFPASWNSFDDAFKTELYRIVSLWLAGSNPVPNLWQKWNFNALEPPNLLKHVGREEQFPKSPMKGFNLDALVKEVKAKQPKEFTFRKALPKQIPQISITKEASSLHATSRSRLLDSTSTFGSTPGESKSVSFADINKALTAQSQLLQRQLERASDTRTLGESTPLMESTAIQHRKLEVAKQQLAELRAVQLRKTQQAKRVGKEGKASTSKKQSQQSQKGKALPQQPEKLQPTNNDGPRPACAGTQLSKALPPATVSKPSIGIQEREGQSPPNPVTTKSVSVSTAVEEQQLGSKQAQGGEASQQQGGDGKRSTGTWKEKALDLTRKSTTKSAAAKVPIQGPKFDHVVFDVHGKSPLVKHYLQKRKLINESGQSLLTQRTEISELPPPDTATYGDVIQSSIKQDKRNQAQCKRHFTRQKKSMAQNQQQRKKATAKHEQDVKKVLSHKKETQQLSSKLTTHILGHKGPECRKVVAKAVSESIKRVSN